MNTDAIRLAATTQYRRAHEAHVDDRALIEARDPHAKGVPQVWMLALNPIEMLARALKAELEDPIPGPLPWSLTDFAAGQVPVVKSKCGCHSCRQKLERGTS